MEHINQLNEWMRQLTNSSQSNYADIAVAKRLLTHSIEAHEKIKQLQAQLESEKVSHAAWEKQSLLEYSEVVQERDALQAKIQQMALEYISEQGQWIDETASLYEMNLAQAKQIKAYQDLCDQLGNALQNCANNEDDVMLTREALAAWIEMKGGCDVPNSE